MTRHRFTLAALMLLVCLPAGAQDTLLEFVKNHASIVSGVAVANGAQSEYVSLALDTDFEVKPKLRGFGNLSLFSRQRVDGGSLPVPEIPGSLTGLAIYSAGEVSGGAYYQWTPRVGFECRGGVTFEMIALTGDLGAPIDGSKFMGACGARLTGGPGRLSVLFGHFGPVIEGEHLFGFVPSGIFDGAFRLTDGVDFLIFVAAGRDLTTQKAVTSARYAVRKRF